MWQKTKNIYHLFRAFVAIVIFGFPAKKLMVIGVTGTDGKTTTVNLIYEILKKAGKKVSMVTSVNAVIGKKIYETGFHVTTPDPWDIQKYLRKMVDAGSQYAVLEVTSHGLDQNRVAFCNFSIGVITNITHEHLDYHKTWQNYFLAKAKLLKNVKFSIINADDKSFALLKKHASGKIITYGVENKADLTLKNFPFKLKILGDYNYYNALVAACVGQVLGVKDQVIKGALEEFEGLIGRMEKIDEGQEFFVFVDFAHTPNALEQALKTLRSQLTVHSSRLISVFGSAGLRDIEKREMMGEVSSRLADYTVICDEDPRTEDPKMIALAIAKGCKKVGGRQGKTFFIINNRRKAIRFAICELAKKGDVVGIFGKGHERLMCYGKTEYPWSDQDEARKALVERRQKEQRGQK
jgi:UDP-N-acetylmuramoyl-L-alanyl-D-glutamate--2,6-diaminopimelate ligase